MDYVKLQTYDIITQLKDSPREVKYFVELAVSFRSRTKRNVFAKKLEKFLEEA